MAKKVFWIIFIACCFVLYNLNMGFVVADVVLGTTSWATIANLAGGIVMVICCIINTIDLIKERL